MQPIQMDSQTKGDMAELKVAAEMRSYGYTVLFPFTGAQQYDLVIDTGDEFVKVQVKYTSLKNNRLKVCCYGKNSSKSGNNKTFYTEDDIDGIATYNDDLDRCFWIPFDELNTYNFTLSEDGDHPMDKYDITNL